MCLTENKIRCISRIHSNVNFLNYICYLSIAVTSYKSDILDGILLSENLEDLGITNLKHLCLMYTPSGLVNMTFKVLQEKLHIHLAKMYVFPLIRNGYFSHFFRLGA